MRGSAIGCVVGAGPGGVAPQLGLPGGHSARRASSDVLSPTAKSTRSSATITALAQKKRLWLRRECSSSGMRVVIEAPTMNMKSAEAAIIAEKPAFPSAS